MKIDWDKKLTTTYTTDTQENNNNDTYWIKIMWNLYAVSRIRRRIFYLHDLGHVAIILQEFYHKLYIAIDTSQIPTRN